MSNGTTLAPIPLTPVVSSPVPSPPAPFRAQFDVARDPYAARNALGIPVFTDTDTVTWDLSTGGQVKANVTETGAASVPHEGRLTYVSTTALLFAPYAGNKIKVDGTIHTIPTAGIAGTANTSVFVNGTGSSNLAADTTYWVYAFDNSGTITADFRTASTHATSSTSGNEGVEIRTSDDTRTLIGIIRTNSSSQFVDSAAQRFVRTWFNRQRLTLHGAATGIITTTSAAYVEMGSGKRVEWVCWGGDAVDISYTTVATADVVGSIASINIGLNAIAASASEMLTQPTGSTYRNAVHSRYTGSGAEGYNWAAPIGALSIGAGTAYFGETFAGGGPALWGCIG